MKGSLVLSHLDFLVRMAMVRLVVHAKHTVLSWTGIFRVGAWDAASSSRRPHACLTHLLSS
jgi:hypothetical protein